ncbi:MAG: uracil-DNA glycosylase [Roseburia sp.]|nr:uracil-DNA glycosylase [Roseburia sp.]
MMVGNEWDDVLRKVFSSIPFQNMMRWLDEEYKRTDVYPPKEQIFSALQHTPYSKVRVVILGQDPYINPNQAHGMAFSVNPGIPIPPSLMNIYRELERDLGCYVPNNGYLVPWADQGVLLLNSVLTVERGMSNSHAKIGWKDFTDAVIRTLNFLDHSVVFMLWGRNAQMKEKLIDPQKHLILKAAHPSPLAGGAFFGCGHFSICNQFLYEISPDVIDWQIPNI